MNNIVIDGPEGADVTFIFAHGAGAGMRDEMDNFFNGFQSLLLAYLSTPIPLGIRLLGI